MAYPNEDIDLYVRRDQQTDLSWAQVDSNWDQIEFALNRIRPTMKLIEDAGGLAAYVESLTFKTGDYKWVSGSTEQTGWLICNHRTIGNGSSGSNLTGDEYQPLYIYLWTVCGNSDLLTSTGASTTKGASALADWGANKRLYTPDAAGRSLVNAGIASGGALNRLIYTKYGAESFTDSRVFTISNIAVTGNVPALVVPAASVNYSGFTGTSTIGVKNFTSTNTYIPTGNVAVTGITMGAPAFVSGTGTFTATNSFTPLGNVAITGITLNAPTFTSGTGTFTSTNTYTPTGAVNSLAITGSGDIAINGASCINAQILELGTSVISCASVLTVSSSDIAATLGGTGTWTATNTFTPTGNIAITGISMAASTFASGTATFTSTNTYNPTGDIAITGVTMSAPAFVSGTATWTATNSFVPTGTVDVGNPPVTFGGALVTIAGATSPTPLVGVTASGSTDPNPLTTLLSPPTFVGTLLIKK